MKEDKKEQEKTMNIIEAKKDSQEWRMDTKGYFLIDPRPEEEFRNSPGVIYAHYYTANKEYQVSIKGKTAEEIYYTILREELISNLMHAAYLGSELQKAEQYIKLKNSKTECKTIIKPYVQDDELSF
jgi:hypothetical protein